MFSLPNPPSTRDKGLDIWLARLHDALKGTWLRPGKNYRIERTTQGTFLAIDPSKGAIKVGLYRWKSMTNDYHICRSFDGTTEGATDVKVAKPDLLRVVTTKTLRGVVINYTNYDLTVNGQKRTATQQGGGTVEVEYITPPYSVNDLIWAIPATTLVTVPNTNPVETVALQDMNIGGRAWAAF